MQITNGPTLSVPSTAFVNRTAPPSDTTVTMPLANTHYDLIVIGSGPAGQKAATTAAKLGKSVVLIDRSDSVGGVCIHTGTIPSKAIREAVLHLTGLRERAMYGASYAVKHDIKMSDLLYRTQYVVRTQVDVIREQMSRCGVRLVYGDASFVDANTIKVERGGDIVELRGTHVLIAVGTEPARPNTVPFTPGKVIDSNELLLMKDLPKSMIIVGGGVIGTEYTCMLAAVGLDVTLVESRPRLMEFVDDEMAESLQFRLRDLGVRLRLGESVAKIEVNAEGVVEATLASNKVLRAETLMYAIGRQGATDGLNLAGCNLTADNRGRLKVNEVYQTEIPHIYAAGDVIGFPALAATSIEQGRVAACHMFQELSEAPNTLYPIGIYSIPEISMIGATEQQLTKDGVPYEVGLARYRDIARGQLASDPHGCLKLIFHPHSRRLLGVHAIGTGATELIHIGQAVMTAGMTIDYFVESIFNYPTLAEAYKIAATDGLSRVVGSNHVDIAKAA